MFFLLHHISSQIWSTETYFTTNESSRDFLLTLSNQDQYSSRSCVFFLPTLQLILLYISVDCFVTSEFYFYFILFYFLLGGKSPDGVFYHPLPPFLPRPEGVFPYSSLKLPGHGLVRWDLRSVSVCLIENILKEKKTGKHLMSPPGQPIRGDHQASFDI